MEWTQDSKKEKDDWERKDNKRKQSLFDGHLVGGVPWTCGNKLQRVKSRSNDFRTTCPRQSMEGEGNNGRFYVGKSEAKEQHSDDVPVNRRVCVIHFIGARLFVYAVKVPGPSYRRYQQGDSFSDGDERKEKRISKVSN